MPNAIVMTGYGPPEVLKWAEVPLAEPGAGQIRIKVKAAGISPTDLALRAGYLKAIPLPPNAVLGFEAAGTVDAVGPGVTGTSIGDNVTALLFSLGGYAEYAVASIWARKPDAVSWLDAAALPSSAEAAVGVLRQLDVQSGETLLLFGGGGSVGIIATQLAVARGVKVISAVGEQDETLARELGATPVRYGAGVADRVRALGAVDAVFDAAGKGVLADAIALAGASGSSPCRTRPPPTSASRCRSPRPAGLPVPWMRRSRCWPSAGSACARTGPCPCTRPPRPTASWKAAPSTSALSSPSTSADGAAVARPAARDCRPGPTRRPDS
jgi:D-arabinose 1-dehydrogenase-like Zn-dependent alcohol dehydrogenase